FRRAGCDQSVRAQHTINVPLMRLTDKLELLPERRNGSYAATMIDTLSCTQTSERSIKSSNQKLVFAHTFQNEPSYEKRNMHHVGAMRRRGRAAAQESTSKKKRDWPGVRKLRGSGGLARRTSCRSAKRVSREPAEALDKPTGTQEAEGCGGVASTSLTLKLSISRSQRAEELPVREREKNDEPGSTVLRRICENMLVLEAASLFPVTNTERKRCTTVKLVRDAEASDIAGLISQLAASSTLYQERHALQVVMVARAPGELGVRVSLPARTAAHKFLYLGLTQSSSTRHKHFYLRKTTKHIVSCIWELVIMNARYTQAGECADSSRSYLELFQTCQ
ncbi:unnamed protein product, partial [Trichogramma brassicae]